MNIAGIEDLEAIDIQHHADASGQMSGVEKLRLHAGVRNVERLSRTPGQKPPGQSIQFSMGEKRVFLDPVLFPLGGHHVDGIVQQGIGKIAGHR